MDEGFVLTAVGLGDALGAGWEMKPRAYMGEHWQEVVSGYKRREGKYGVRHAPGKTTDDTEQTRGVLRALEKYGHDDITTERLVECMIDVADNPIVRAGPTARPWGFPEWALNELKL